MSDRNLKVVTAAQMAALEQAAERQGISTDSLMENAGLAVAVAARKQLGSLAGARVLVLVGPGNNGADGLVTARHLQRWGARVTAYIVARRPDPDPKMRLALSYGVSPIHAADDSGLEQLDSLLGRCRLVVDAVLGTGRTRPLAGLVQETMQRVNAARSRNPGLPLLALDLPTGLNPDTGEVDPSGLTADLTVALGLPKAGLLTFPGADRVGRLQVVDIGLPRRMPEEESIDLELLTPGWVGRQLPSRPLNSHKGTFGHALVVAGSRNYVGAACLASQAALRAGAGLVTLATPASVYPIAAGRLTEVIHFPLPEDGEGRIDPSAAELIRSELSRFDSLLVGCGMGCSAGTAQFMERLLLQEIPEPPPQIPTVVDADGLNSLSMLPRWWERLGAHVALTPHPGEMATLTGATIPQVQQDRIATSRRWSAHWKLSLALKGAHTVIAEPQGLVRVSPFANPGLASGGTGDVLTGVIAGLMAQGLTPYTATCCGVYLHGLAGEAVTRRKGKAGALASDLIEELPGAISRLGPNPPAD